MVKHPMVKQLFVRMASGAGLLALALVFVGADPFLSAGASTPTQTPTTSVDRTFKGDRLPVLDPAFVPDWQNEFGSSPKQPARAQMPFACDAAISTIMAPTAANIYRRCMA